MTITRDQLAVRAKIGSTCIVDEKSPRCSCLIFINSKQSNLTMAEVILSGKKIFVHVDGFIFCKRSVNSKTKAIYWKCRDCVVTSALNVPKLDGAKVQIRGKGDSNDVVL